MINKSWGDVEFISNGFRWKATDYRFSDVRHLFFKRVRTQHSVNFVNTIKTDAAGFRITLAGGLHIDLTHKNAGWISKDLVEMSDALSELYLHFSKMTFQRRLNFYQEQLDRRGFFEYEGCQFFPDEKIVSGNTSYSMKTSVLLKGYGYIELKKKAPTLSDKLLRVVIIPQFGTLTDSDVLFHLLQQKFGLSWNV